MSKILVTYSTNAGSTAEVAQEVAEELNQGGHTTDCRPIAEVTDCGGYDAVVVGAPMIFGWHSSALKFVKNNARQLSGIKTAYFACAMRLTEVPGAQLPSISLALDPNLAANPQKLGSLNIKERFTALGYYLNPMVKAAPETTPLSIAFFKGKVDMRSLKWWQAAFVMMVVQATPGDYRDWDYIKSWARSLSKQI